MSLHRKLSGIASLVCGAFTPSRLSRSVTQASKLGYLAVARHAFERGLRINPHHPLLLDRLLDVTLALGDWEAAGQVSVVSATLLHEAPTYKLCAV